MKVVRKYTEKEREQFKFLEQELKHLQENPDISEPGFKKLNNLINQLTVMRDSYYLRLLSLAKQDEL